MRMTSSRRPRFFSHRPITASDSPPSRPGAHAEYTSAVAGIGYPQRFFNSLIEQGIELENSQSFADHHAFSQQDFSNLASNPILMTEKDAGKCQSFARADWYYQTIEAKLPEVMKTNLLAELERKKNGHR